MLQLCKILEHYGGQLTTIRAATAVEGKVSQLSYIYPTYH